MIRRLDGGLRKYRTVFRGRKSLAGKKWDIEKTEADEPHNRNLGKISRSKFTRRSDDL